MNKLPEEFLKKMHILLGEEEYQEFLNSYEAPRKFGLRVNTSKISVEDFKRLAPFNLTPIPWCDNGFYYEEKDQPSRHSILLCGAVLSGRSQVLWHRAAILPIEPGMRVLDLCAAPGGKATELGAKLLGEGLLAANDISASRVKALLKNVEVFGISNSFLMNETPAHIAEQFPEFFDRILVDAPCSGEGMFRKDADVAKAWTPDKPEACAKAQKEIILQAAKMLKPGGIMLYSTCTFAPEEDEQVFGSCWKSARNSSCCPLEKIVLACFPMDIRRGQRMKQAPKERSWLCAPESGPTDSRERGISWHCCKKGKQKMWRRQKKRTKSARSLQADEKAAAGRLERRKQTNRRKDHESPAGHSG